MSSRTNQNVNQRITATAWAEVTIKEFRKRIKNKRIGSSGRLAREFAKHVESSAGGDVQKIKMSFMFYGMFVDMGVGKGTKINDVKENAIQRRLTGSRGIKRRPKKWYSETMETEVFQLGRIMAEKYGVIAFNEIKEILPKQATVGV